MTSDELPSDQRGCPKFHNTIENGGEEFDIVAQKKGTAEVLLTDTVIDASSVDLYLGGQYVNPLELLQGLLVRAYDNGLMNKHI